MTQSHDGSDDSALVVSSLSKSYGATRALEDVSFAVPRGSVHALIGGNGSGKSTLVKILAGVVQPDGGEIVVAGQQLALDSMTARHSREHGLHFVHQEPATFPDLSVAENLSLGRGYDHGAAARIRWRDVHRRTRRVLDRFGISVDSRCPMSHLGPAEQTLVEIARALQDQDDAHSGVLILDEPTAALSATEVDILLTALRGYATMGQTILLITHRLDEVLTVADEVTVLRDGRHVVTRPTEGLTTADLAELIVGRRLADPVDRTHPETRELLLEVNNLVDGPLDGIDLQAARGEILGIAGLLGSGRTHLLTTLFGVHPGYSGEIRIRGTAVKHRHCGQAMAAGIAYVPEDRPVEGIFADRSVAENLSAADVRRFWRHGHLARRSEVESARHSVAANGIVTRSVHAAITTLSGGNQQKVVFARWLRLGPDLLLLDEPSQGVDVGAREELHQLIRAATAHGAAAIVVSSDAEELARLCDRVVGLRGGRIVGELTGHAITAEAVVQLSYGTSEVTA